MTPQEIFEYKNRWMNNNPFCIEVGEDVDFKGKQWCKQNLQPHQWKFIEYSGMYEHMFCFEQEHHMNQFERYVNQR